MLTAARESTLRQYPNSENIAINLDYSEAFGIIRALSCLNYGYIGADYGDDTEFNLKAWLYRLKKEVLDEIQKNGLSDTLDKYRKLNTKNK